MVYIRNMFENWFLMKWKEGFQLFLFCDIGRVYLPRIQFPSFLDQSTLCPVFMIVSLSFKDPNNPNAVRPVRPTVIIPPSIW